MTIRVPAAFNNAGAADMKVAKPASATRVGLPIQAGINHLLGNILGGLRHCQAGASGVTTQAHIMTYRHPNCEALVVSVGQDETTTQAATITAQIGSNTPVTVEDPTPGPTGQRVTLEPTFSSGQTGWTTLIVSTANRTIGSLAVWDLARRTLGSGDDRLEHEDSSNPLVSLAVWDAIGDSSEAGPKGMIQEVIDAWDHYHPQHVSWWADTALSVDSASWTDPFDGQIFKAMTRQKKAETSNTAYYRVRSWCAASTTYSYRITSSNPVSGSDTVTVTGLTNTDEAWVAPVEGLEVDCTGDSNLTLEFQRTAGSGKIYVIAWGGGDE